MVNGVEILCHVRLEDVHGAPTWLPPNGAWKKGVRLRACVPLPTLQGIGMLDETPLEIWPDDLDKGMMQHAIRESRSMNHAPFRLEDLKFPVRPRPPFSCQQKAAGYAAGFLPGPALKRITSLWYRLLREASLAAVIRFSHSRTRDHRFRAVFGISRITLRKRWAPAPAFVTYLPRGSAAVSPLRTGEEAVPFCSCAVPATVAAGLLTYRSESGDGNPHSYCGCCGSNSH